MAARADTLRISALCFAGLAELAVRELRELAETDVSATRIRDYDRLSFAVRAENVPRLRALRTTEDIFLDLGNVARIERAADLARLGRIVRKNTVLSALQVKNRFDDTRTNRRKTTTFACFVKQDKDRRLRRKQISDRVESLLAQQFPRWRRADPAQVEIWVFWQGRASLALRLTDERFKYRGMKPPRREAALRPTIAAAMAALASPQDGETVLDPTCGSGTLLLECRALNERARLVGADRSRYAIDLARSRIGRHAALHVRDARSPLEERVDCIVCNLPWGHTYDANATLYRELLESFARALHRGGRMVLLTDRTRMLESALDTAGFVWSSAARVLVRGKWATIYRAHRE